MELSVEYVATPAQRRCRWGHKIDIEEDLDGGPNINMSQTVHSSMEFDRQG